MLQSLYQNRVRFMAIALFIIGAIFVMRLFYIQVIRHDHYVQRAAAEQIKTLTLPAERGEIYIMSHGQPRKIVINETVYSVIADPKITTEDDEIVKVVNQVAGGDARPNLDQLLAKKDTRYQVLATDLTHSQAEDIKQAELSGVILQRNNSRAYPEGNLAAQTLGFVNADGVGVYGVEGGLNDLLNGKDGLLKSVTDVANVPLTIGDQNIDRPAQDGQDIVLSLDRNIQSKVEQVLRDRFKDIPHKSAIVMDPSNGHILAMANTPSYNPGEYNQVKDIAQFNNSVISDPYEAGSVMKTFTVAIGIDTGTIKPTSTFYNTDHVKIGQWDIGNATTGYTGNITFQRALDLSLNTGMVEIAQRLGDGTHVNQQAQETMYRYLHDRLKLGQKSGLELSNEQPGIIISPDKPEGNAIRYANMAFGQGMDLTMLQVASGLSAIVNGGVYHQPSVIAGTMDGSQFTPSQPRSQPEQVISKSTSAQARKMIHDARNSVYSGMDKSGYYIGGKTGTGETALNGKYTMATTVASYLGFGGQSGELPKYVIMVRASGDGMNLQGHLHAMPIFTDISNWLLEYYQLPPKGN